MASGSGGSSSLGSGRRGTTAAGRRRGQVRGGTDTAAQAAVGF